MKTRSNALWAAAMALSAGLVCATAVSGISTTRDGAFTAEQAERGKTVYEQSCANCHQEDFYRDRLTRFQNKPVKALFETISTSMPQDNVGGLLTSEYVDVLAYIFLITGSPAGKSELTTDNMESINIAAAN